MQDRIRLRRNPSNVAVPQGADDLYFNASGQLVHESPGGTKEVIGEGDATLVAEINTQTGTTYTILAADVGKIIVCTNAAGCTLSLPASLGAGFNFAVISTLDDSSIDCAGTVSVNGTANATVPIPAGYAAASLVAIAANSFAASGNIGTIS